MHTTRRNLTDDDVKKVEEKKVSELRLTRWLGARFLMAERIAGCRLDWTHHRLERRGEMARGTRRTRPISEKDGSSGSSNGLLVPAFLSGCRLDVLMCTAVDVLVLSYPSRHPSIRLGRPEWEAPRAGPRPPTCHQRTSHERHLVA